MFTSSSSTFIIYISILAGMAFFTLLERKALGYFQLRKGPNKVSLMGVPQPLADALKLFSKELNKPTLSNLGPFLVAPIIGLVLALVMWSLYPSEFPLTFYKYGVLMFLVISSLSVYSTLSSGWSSNNKYSLLGSLRGVAQTISYEVSMSLILITSLVFHSGLDLLNMLQMNKFIMATLCPILFYIWFTTSVAETNRTPFDFAEGESELVSGFNTEYSGGSFALIFMAEYINIIFMSLLSALLFCISVGSPLVNLLLLLIQTLMLSFMFLWLRGTLPRMRYDLLMMLTWKSYLPIALFMLILYPALS